MKILPTILIACCTTLIVQGADLSIGPVPGAEINLYVEKTGLLSGKTHRFTFDRFSGRVSGVDFVQFQIDSASIVCRDEWVNEKDRAKIVKVALEDMLAAKKYPGIAFRSTKIVDAGGGKWTVSGMLTIRDMTKPVEIKLDSRANRIYAGEATVRLTDYGLKPPSAVLGAIGTKNEMRLVFTLPLTPGGRTGAMIRLSHWPEYLSEAVGLGLFMLSACAFTVLLEHPMSSLHNAVESGLARRVLMGLAMGATALGITLSPPGQRSGAHLNPALTFTFWLLGKVRTGDAIAYVVAQLVGGALGVMVADFLLGSALAHSAVHFAVTVPGPPGPWVAFAAELTISFILMLAILTVSNHRHLHRWTPWCAAALIATWIVVEAPLSGMSMNPARTAASAFCAGVWTDWWIYLIAPALGMFAASRVWLAWRGAGRVYCAKLNHENDRRCIFRCNFGAL